MDEIFPVKAEFTVNTWCNQEKYHRLSQLASQNPEEFWSLQAHQLDWLAPWRIVKDCSFHKPVHIRWFVDGKLNVSLNCIDRHLRQRAQKTAIIWEPDDPNAATRYISYQELHDEVCKMANILKAHKVKKGDKVTIYMPMIPEAAFAMLACARIGATHSVVFAGFSPDALAGRLQDCESTFLITADEARRGGKTFPLKANCDEALTKCPLVTHVLVVENTGCTINWQENRDISYKNAKQKAATTCLAEVMDAEDPLFILYTSGSTGKPKGVVHTTGGYLVYAAYTHHYIFDYHDEDIYWCTADIGWVTGHSYSIYGPLANGATTVMFEGIPLSPTPARHWQIVDKHKVSIYYSSPTAIRSLMQQGEEPVKETSRKSLRLLGVVGEPINPAAWLWYYKVIGDTRCPIVDTWWQTETGGILISALPGATPLKPGSATLPLFGIKPVVVNEKGEHLEGECDGYLCLEDSWPGQAHTIYKDHKRFEQTYFSHYQGLYFTGDGCHRDKDGYYWITGRVDDVINVAGHRLGTAEIESALVAHPSVAESAVVGVPHDIKGQGIYAFVTLKNNIETNDALRNELIQHVRKHLSPIATIDFLQWTPVLPKTRSGKIMRRILRKIVENDLDNLGDTSTLADPSVVDALIKGKL